MSDDFTNQLSELEMSPWLFQQRSIFVPALFSKGELWAHEWPYVVHLDLAFNACYTLWEKAVVNVKNILLPPHPSPPPPPPLPLPLTPPHRRILIRCSVAVSMWPVGSAICPFLTIHIITTCCSDSWILSVTQLWGHLSLFYHCLFNHGRPINSAGPRHLRGHLLPTTRVSHCLDPFTSVVNE